MATEIISVTSVNDQLWKAYAEKTVSTWTTPYKVYWEDRDTDPQWDQWRASNLDKLEPDFKHTWRRFSYKVQHQLKAYREFKDTHRYLIWQDADVRELCKPTAEFYKKVLPITRAGGQWLDPSDTLSYLGRGDSYHPETGYIVYDLHNPRITQVLLRLEEVYLTNEIFTMNEWHDAYVWEEVCRAQQISRRNLCERPHKPGEAFARSPLRDYYEHLKGPRKYQ